MNNKAVFGVQPVLSYAIEEAVNRLRINVSFLGADVKKIMVVSHGGNFIVTARDPRGPWSEPIWVKQGGIDPSLYFEDGRCFMVSNPSDAIWLCELNPLTGEQLTESRKIWQGMGGRYPEAPHLYKKDGYYYLLIAEGGTEYGHSMTIARSRAIEGPYEGNPDNPILCHQRQATQGSPIQGTGHGDFVQAADGSWWCVFLAFRTYGGNYHHLGRETFLSPVEWNEGEWPVVNGNGTVDTLMNVRTLPQVPLPTKPNSYDFAAYRKFGPEWIFIQNPDRSKYEFTPNALRLHVSESDLLENRQPTFVGQRQVSADVDISSTVDVAGLRIGAEAGLVVYQINNGYYRLYLQRDAQGTHVMLGYRVRSLANDREIMLTKATKVRLHISSDGNMYNFACQDVESGARADGGGFECAMISTEVAGGFTGVTIGMYAVGAADGGYADFTNIAYRTEITD